MVTSPRTWSPLLSVLILNRKEVCLENGPKTIKHATNHLKRKQHTLRTNYYKQCTNVPSRSTGRRRRYLGKVVFSPDFHFLYFTLIFVQARGGPFVATAPQTHDERAEIRRKTIRTEIGEFGAGRPDSG